MLEFFFLFVSVLPWRDRAIAIRDDLTSRIDRDKEGKRDRTSEKSRSVHGTFLQATNREIVPKRFLLFRKVSSIFFDSIILQDILRRKHSFQIITLLKHDILFSRRHAMVTENVILLYYYILIPCIYKKYIFFRCVNRSRKDTAYL